ncbi:MAG: hypothetical protein FJ358_02990 [Thaumarchaeota archaeon]|nr:hypothetical protein [Nitrososphaerota archaeon]
MSNAIQELTTLVKEKVANRLALVIADSDIHLNSEHLKHVYVLELAISNAAGGRGAGYGSREVARVHCFKNDNGLWAKNIDISDNKILEGFEPPYYVSLLPLTLNDGSEIMAYGAVAPELIAEYNKKFLHL